MGASISQRLRFGRKIREQALQKAESEPVSLGARLNRGKLRQRGAISKKVRELLRTHPCHQLLRVTIESRVRIQQKRLRPGRPKKNDPIREIRSHVYHLKVRREKAAIRADARTDGVFPLVTNLDTRGVSKKQILLIYKYQPYVEKRHALFKSELGVAPVYLKKPNRAAGLVHATFLAMILDALIERTVRRGMQAHGITELPVLPEGRPSTAPTTARILEVFSGVSWFEFERGGETITFPIQLTRIQKDLLRLLGLDRAVYA